MQLLIYKCGHLCYASTGRLVPAFGRAEVLRAAHINAPCPQCPHPEPRHLPPRPYDELPMGGSDAGGVHR